MGRGRGRGAHSGMFPCFFGGFLSRFVSSTRERRDQPRARAPGLDHVVEVAALGGDVGVGEALAGTRRSAAASRGRRVVGRRDLLAEDDLDRALRRPSRRSRRVGQARFRSPRMCLRAHDVVGAAVGLARDDGELRHRRLAVGVEQLGAVLDDPVPLLVGAGQEAGHVLEGDERDVEAVAEADEARALDRGVDVEARRRAPAAGWRRCRPRGRRGARSRRRCSRRSARGPRGSRRRRRRGGSPRGCRRACSGRRGRACRARSSIAVRVVGAAGRAAGPPCCSAAGRTAAA